MNLQKLSARQQQQGTCMGNEPGSNQLTDHDGQVGCNGIHSVLEVFGEFVSIGVHSNDLVTQREDVLNIL